MFGAIQGGSAGPPPGLAVVVRGPTEPVTVRRRERVLGIWVNRRAVRFESVPGYYAVATTAPVEALLDERNAAIHEIGLDFLQLSPAGYVDPDEARQFQAGLVDLRREAGLYVEQPYGVRLTADVLFRARIPMPSAVPVGEYLAEVFLISDGRVRAKATAPILVEKSGFERSIFLFAHRHGLAYGLGSVGLAVLAGLAGGLLGVRRPA